MRVKAASSPSVVAGLVIGKPVGVLLGGWLVARFTRAELDPSIGWRDVVAKPVVRRFAALRAGLRIDLRTRPLVCGLAAVRASIQTNIIARPFVRGLAAVRACFRLRIGEAQSGAKEVYLIWRGYRDDCSSAVDDIDEPCLDRVVDGLLQVAISTV